MGQYVHYSSLEIQQLNRSSCISGERSLSRIWYLNLEKTWETHRKVNSTSPLKGVSLNIHWSDRSLKETRPSDKERTHWKKDSMPGKRRRQEERGNAEDGWHHWPDERIEQIRESRWRTYPRPDSVDMTTTELNWCLNAAKKSEIAEFVSDFSSGDWALICCRLPTIFQFSPICVWNCDYNICREMPSLFPQNIPRILIADNTFTGFLCAWNFSHYQKVKTDEVRSGTSQGVISICLIVLYFEINSFFSFKMCFTRFSIPALLPGR